MEEWDVVQNLPLTPAQVSRGSRRQVWWRCGAGHSWQAAVYARTGSGTGCPVCGGKRPWRGENDLASLRPDLARQWHPVKNGALTPDQVLPGSHRLAWWVCQRGHEWRAQIKARAAGSGCPVCANREIRSGENDLEAAYPRLAAQWDWERNGSLTPRDVVSGSTRKVWWICEQGHRWQASVVSRTSGGSGCPVCTGRKVVPGENDLASRFPELAAQWDTEANGVLTPARVTAYANRKVWWRCPLGHGYQAAVSSRTMQGSGCPYCTGRKVLAGFNDLASRVPALAAQWHPTLNGTLTPEMVTAGSHRKVWWVCSEGHVWRAVVYSRAGHRMSGCPVCAVTVRRPERYGASALGKGVMEAGRTRSGTVTAVK